MTGSLCDAVNRAAVKCQWKPEDAFNVPRQNIKSLTVSQSSSCLEGKAKLNPDLSGLRSSYRDVGMASFLRRLHNNMASTFFFPPATTPIQGAYKGVFR